VSDDENQETRESPAVSTDDQAPSGGEVSFSVPEEDQAGGDSIGAGGPSDSPAAAQARAESGDESPLDRPEVQILGAFLGAFIVAKILQKLLSRD
jgi:hypothetical protein